jgi:hypothetical protein
MLAARGVPDLTIQRILRHSNVTTTRKSYIKIREDKVRAGMEIMEEATPKRERLQTEAKNQSNERVNGCKFRGSFLIIH